MFQKNKFRYLCDTASIWLLFRGSRNFGIFYNFMINWIIKVKFFEIHNHCSSSWNKSEDSGNQRVQSPSPTNIFTNKNIIQFWILKAKFFLVIVVLVRIINNCRQPVLVMFSRGFHPVYCMCTMFTIWSNNVHNMYCWLNVK